MHQHYVSRTHDLPTMRKHCSRMLSSLMQVPEDAWELDLVFSDSGSGGAGPFYDNNGGFDYHVPVRGSVRARPQLSVVHVAVEMAPIAKAGVFSVCSLCGRTQGCSTGPVKALFHASFQSNLGQCSSAACARW